VKSIVQTSALIINTVYRNKLGRSFRLSTRSGIPRIFQLTKKSSASAKTKPLGRTPKRSTDLSMTARSSDDHSTRRIPHKILVAFALHCSIRRRTPRPLTCFEQSILTSISKIAIQRPLPSTQEPSLRRAMSVPSFCVYAAVHSSTAVRKCSTQRP
jgi:hypothetical protein